MSLKSNKTWQRDRQQNGKIQTDGVTRKRTIWNVLELLNSTLYSILHEHLAVKKICSRWISQNLTIAQFVPFGVKKCWKKNHGGASQDVYKIVTGDESWICAYEPETKQQSTVWVFEPEPNPTKVVCGKITSKQMVACFFCKTGHVATVPLEHRRTVNPQWSTTTC